MPRISRRKKRTLKRKHRGGDAPLSYDLSKSWSSTISHGQGGDYLKFHKAQHGGEAPLDQFDSGLPPSLRSAAMMTSQDTALSQINGLHDQTGGRRRRRSHRSHRSHRRRGSSHRRRSHRPGHLTRRRRGGASHLVAAPFPSKAMLLDSSSDYARAGLHQTGWDDVEKAAAVARSQI